MLESRHGTVSVIIATAGLSAALAFSPALASASQESVDAAMPVGISAVLENALASGDPVEIEAVSRVAKRTYPAFAELIERRLALWRTSRQTVALPPVLAINEPAAVPTRSLTVPASLALPTLPSLVKWSGEGEAGAFANTGNAPGIGLVGGFKMLVEGSNWRIGTNARADYQETAGVVTREQYRFSAEPNYKFDERGYLFGLGQYEKDRFQGFDSRYSLSGGLGYNLLKSDEAKLSLKGGPAWRVTNPVDGERESVVAGLASLEAKFKLTPTLTYSQDASAYVDAEGSTFYTLAALDSRLMGKLKARLSYMVQYETAPELGRIGTDTTSRLTLVYGF